MKYRSRYSPGKLTNGEARQTVALISGVEPEDIEQFIVIAVHHAASDFHEVIISSNLGKDRDRIDALLFLAHRSTMDKIYTYPQKDIVYDRRVYFPWFRRRRRDSQTAAYGMGNGRAVCSDD